MTATELSDVREPTEREALQAGESARTLASYVDADCAMQLQILEGEQPGDRVTLPPVALRLLRQLLTELAAGNAVALIPVHAELTTQEAADFLQVSRPFLVGLLERGELPFRRVGTHRRVAFRDLLAYREASQQQGRQALEELAAEAQELGLGY